MQKKGIFILTTVLTVLIIFQTSCTKLVEANAPHTSINAQNVYTNDATAIAAVTGIYTDMSGGAGFSGRNRISFLLGLSSDELTLSSGVIDFGYLSYYRNQLTSTSTASGGADFWLSLYPIIYRANAAIEGLSASTELTPIIKQQLLGEAKFIRAISFFYLVNLYGDIPLVTTTDYKVNASLARIEEMQIWQQIVSDLNDAKSMLSSTYLNGSLVGQTVERVRPTKWAASTLLARAYLYTGEYAKAEAEATSVINNTALYDTVLLNDVFLKNSKEAIWQLQPVGTGPTNTWDGYTFIIPSAGPDNFQAYLSTNLLSSFEVNDQRRIKWVDSTTANGTKYLYAFKYKINTNVSVSEYTMVLRLGELYLIRAEARAQQGNISGAASDINIIRKRAGLLNTTANNQSTLLTAIQHERQVELFTEWGHRWLDLKRTGLVTSVMPSITTQKGGVWENDNHDKWYPVPLSELKANPKLTQTPGY